MHHRAKFTSIAWTHDDKGYFYTRYKKPETVSGDKAGTETDESKNQMVLSSSYLALLYDDLLTGIWQLDCLS